MTRSSTRRRLNKSRRQRQRKGTRSMRRFGGKSRKNYRRKTSKSKKRLQRGSGFLGDLKNSVSNTFSGLYKRITGKNKQDVSGVNPLDIDAVDFSKYDSLNNTDFAPSSGFPTDASKEGLVGLPQQVGGISYQHFY